MALTVCAYCDKTFGESKPKCPHCGRPQMDLVTHAMLITSQLEREEENLPFAEIIEDPVPKTKVTITIESRD